MFVNASDVENAVAERERERDVLMKQRNYVSRDGMKVVGESVKQYKILSHPHLFIAFPWNTGEMVVECCSFEFERIRVYWCWCENVNEFG